MMKTWLVFVSAKREQEIVPKRLLQTIVKYCSRGARFEDNIQLPLVELENVPQIWCISAHGHLGVRSSDIYLKRLQDRNIDYPRI